MTDRLEALADEFETEANRVEEDGEETAAWTLRDAARRVREVAAELAPELLPQLGMNNTADTDAVPAELDDPTPIHDDVHAQVYGGEQ